MPNKNPIILFLGLLTVTIYVTFESQSQVYNSVPDLDVYLKCQKIVNDK